MTGPPRGYVDVCGESGFISLAASRYRFHVAESVIRELDTMPERVRNMPEAAGAVALGRKLDAGGEISVAPVHKELREVMRFLRELAGGQEASGDAVDDLAARRAARLSAPAG